MIACKQVTKRFGAVTALAPFDLDVATGEFIAINGASLTIGEVRGNRFNIHLIPETLRATTFGSCEEGQRVNIEIDSQTQTIVDTLARLGYDRPAPTL